MSDGNRAWDTALDVFVYGPLGLAVAAREELPGIVRDLAERGRRELDHQRAEAGRRLGGTRAVGHFAVHYGAPRLRAKVRTGLGAVRAAARTGRGTAPPGAPAAGDGRNGSVRAGGPAPAVPPAGSRTGVPAGNGHARPTPRAAGVDVPSVGSLAIPDYDELSASQVVQRLVGLTPAELEAVRRYESAQRARQTVLGRIAQLAP